jgi:hypothetical protein
VKRGAPPEEWILTLTFAAVAIVLIVVLVAGSVAP